MTCTSSRRSPPHKSCSRVSDSESRVPFGHGGASPMRVVSEQRCRDVQRRPQLRLNPDAAHAFASVEESASSAGTQRGPLGECITTDNRDDSSAMPMYVPSRPTNGWLAQMTRRFGVVERLRRWELLSIGRRQSRSGFKWIRCPQRGREPAKKCERAKK